MKRWKYVALLSICWIALTERYAIAGRVDVIQLTKPQDVRDAAAMGKAIDEMSGKVMKCVRDKLAPAGKCFCLYPKELARTRKIYEDTVSRHPHWKDKTVSYALDDRSGAVSFDGLRRQFEKKCP